MAKKKKARKIRKRRVPVCFEDLSEKSKRSWGIPAYYVDKTYSCVDCGNKCLFSAMQQKEWYEVEKRYFWQRPIRCDECHREWRETRSSKFKMDRLLARLKDAPRDRELMVECALQIVDYHRRAGQGNLELALHLLKAQDCDESLVLGALDYCREQLKRSYSVVNGPDREWRSRSRTQGVEYNALPGEGKAGEARELVLCPDRQGRLPELVKKCDQLRPQVSWEEETPESTTHKPLSDLNRREPFEPKMILIPAGEFIMGSDPSVDEDAINDEQPQHYLCLPDFYIAKTPTTNAQYAAFVLSADHEAPSHWEDRRPPQGQEDHPVVNVTWYDAVTYCNWLSDVTGKAYRLPSEAEWEKAARGTDGRIYPWGNEWDMTWLGACAYPRKASPYGVLDMAGNGWEWTRSLYKDYPYDPTDGREDLEADDSRALRGGWLVIQIVARAACRLGGLNPNERGESYGFRVCVATRQD